METGDAEAKGERSLGMGRSKEGKGIEFSPRAVPTQRLESTSSAAEDKSSFSKKRNLVFKYKRKENDVEKATGPGRNGSPQSKTRLAADQIYDRAPPKQATGTEKNALYMKQKEVKGNDSGQEVCLAPTSTSKSHRGFEVSQRQIPDSQEDRDSLKARVVELRRETCMLSRELQKYATMCMELSNDNRLLMDELKKMCEPDVIKILEDKNPDNNPQTDRE